MRTSLAILTLVLATACGPRPGSVLISLTFESETQTRCVRVFARTASGNVVNASPSAINRTDDRIDVGLAETGELQGELEITVERFAETGCSGTPFASETKPVTLATGQSTTLAFVFRGEGSADAGTDGGTTQGDDGGTDGGTDAGCELATCPAPGECEVQATACLAPGSCSYEPRAPGTSCGDAGVCAGGQCMGDVCAVSPGGTACDDNLPCTSLATCTGGLCVPLQCAVPPPACQRIRQPIIACEPTSTSLCLLEPDPTQDGDSCQGGGGRCLSGSCRPWLPAGFSPRFFEFTVGDVPYPTGPWTLTSLDGGTCAVVLNTGPASPPFVEDGGCGLPQTITARSSPDGGLALFTMTGLSVDPRVEVHFTGTRPAQLLVLGDATIDGLVSVAPQLLGVRPAGAHPVDCADAGSGSADDQGGGGGGFGAAGGVGGSNPTTGGGASPSAAKLRGGCGGGNGFFSGSLVPGGIGGGAIDVIVTGTLSVRGSGAVTASGGGGGASNADKRGGGGGGSGGMVVLEADVLNIIDGGAVTANGGNGGEGGKNGESSAPGAMGSFTLEQRVPSPGTSPGGGNGGRGGVGTGSQAAGEDGGLGTGSGNPGSGGAGGSVGVIYIKARTSCSRSGGVLSGAQPEALACP